MQAADLPSAIKDIHHHPPAVTLDVRHPLSIQRNLVTQQTQTMTDVISKCPDMEKAFLKAIS